MDFSLSVVPQPSMLNTSNAQANAAKRVLRFTAKYLRKEIFRIVAASVTRGKVTKVMAPHRGEGLFGGVLPGHRRTPEMRQNSGLIYNQGMPDPMPEPMSD